MYEKLIEAQNRIALSNELMLYHMKVSDEDVRQVLNCPHKHVTCGYDEFHFSPRDIRIPETICYLLRMYEDLGLVKKFDIKRERLVKFLLYVYR